MLLMLALWRRPASLCLGLRSLLLLLILVGIPISGSASVRILTIDGYVDGMPFIWRLRDAIRARLEEANPGTAVHGFSLDAYRPRGTQYIETVQQYLQLNYGGNTIDLIILLDPAGIDFFDQHLKSLFPDVPVMKMVDQNAEIPALQRNEYALILKPDFVGTIRLARHHYPQLKHLYLLGDRFNEEQSTKAIRAAFPDLAITTLGQRTLAEMRATIRNLQPGDLLFFELLFADGSGEPMVPPVRYVDEFNRLSPVPIVCMYRNFIDFGCIGGAVSSPETQASALVATLQQYFWHLLNSDLASNSRPTELTERERIQTLAATQLVADLKQLEAHNLNTDPLPGAIYLNQPIPLTQRYAHELFIALAITLLLFIAFVSFWLARRGQQQLEARLASLSYVAPVGIFWRNSAKTQWHHNLRIDEWAERVSASPAKILQRCQQLIADQQSTTSHLEFQHQEKSLTVRVKVPRDNDSPDIYVLEDITELQLQNRKMEQLALIDDLTQLPNRRSLMETLERWIARSKRNQTGFALVMMDLDGFKEINDQYGHAAGDQVLQVAAKRLKNHIRGSDLVSRLGGDEFCILAAEIEDHSQAINLCEKLLEVIEQPFSYALENGEPVSLQVSASLGARLYPVDADTTEALLIAADQAMYQIKHRKRAN